MEERQNRVTEWGMTIERQRCYAVNSSFVIPHSDLLQVRVSFAESAAWDVFAFE